MRVAVLGATGRTGREVVESAVRRGHQVTAAARTAPSVAWPVGVDARSVDVGDATAVAAVLAEADAAVFAVGAVRGATEVYSTGAANVLAGLPLGARVSLVSAVPAGPRADLPRGQRVAASALSAFFGATYADMRRMESVLAGSTVDWVCLRPPRLTNRPALGDYLLGERPVGGSITRADLATALLDVLDRPELYRSARYVAN